MNRGNESMSRQGNSSEFNDNSIISDELLNIPRLKSFHDVTELNLPPKYLQADELIKRLPKKKQTIIRAIVFEKLRRKELKDSLEKQVLQTVRNQNQVLGMLKAMLQNYFEHSPQYMHKRVEETVELIKMKRKHKKKMKILKLRTLVDNLRMMVEINPHLMEIIDFKIFFMDCKKRLKDEIAVQKQRAEEGSFISELSDSSGDSFSDDSQMSQGERMRRKRERRQQKIEQKKKEKEDLAIAQEKEKIVDAEKEVVNEFQVPDGMLLMSKKDYMDQLAKLTDDAKNMVKNELAKLHELAQKELEDERLAKEALAKRRRSLFMKLKACFHKISFVKYLYRKWDYKTKKKREVSLKTYSEKLSGYIDLCFLVVKNIILKNFRQVWDQEKSTNIITNPEICFMYKEKPPSSKDIDENANFIEESLRKILRGMIEMCKEEIYGSTLCQFLVDITTNSNFLPQSFLSMFEIKRVEFSSNGSLANISKGRRKLLQGSFVLFYILINKVLTKPWTFDSSFKETNQRRLFLRILGSALFYFTIEYFKKEVPVVENNQVHIAISLRNEPRKKLFKMDERLALTAEHFPEDTIFEDILSKEDLKVIFIDKLAKFAKIPELIEEFLNKLDEMVMRVRVQTMAELKEKRRLRALEQKALMIRVIQRKNFPIVVSNPEEIGEYMEGKFLEKKPLLKKVRTKGKEEGSKSLATQNSHISQESQQNLRPAPTAKKLEILEEKLNDENELSV